MGNDQKITVETDLLAAIAKWTSDDVASRLGRIIFRDHEIIAGDGKRLVRAPFATCATLIGEPPAMAVLGRDILAAIAAQNVLARNGIDPPLDHDLWANRDGDSVLTDGPHGDRTIDIWREGERAVIGIGAIELRCLAFDPADYPKASELAAVESNPGAKPAPDGVVFQPQFLAAIHEINTASYGRTSGVRVVGWRDVRSPVTFVNQQGVRMTVCPMLPFEEQKKAERALS